LRITTIPELLCGFQNDTEKKLYVRLMTAFSLDIMQH
jgi:hypothetical protein